MTITPDKAWRAGRFWWDSSRPGPVDPHPLGAVVFDLDALADVECGGHRLAFNAAFAAHGLGLTWSAARYRKLLALPDERQRVAAELRARGVCTECDVLLKVLVEQLCAAKARMLGDVMLGADLDARTGLVELVTDAFTAGVAVGVVGAGRRQWVQPLVRQLIGDGLVQTIVTADDLAPAAPLGAGFRLALAELGVRAHDALAFTGSGDGMRGAAAAGLPGVLVDPQTLGARADYDGLRVTDCRRLHTASWARGARSAAA
ncbi:haloacid dehalogenase [Mycolicibacterium sp. P1-18]|uniref:HAD family hydrolase n=1 Tax=Mycolicibacterium sp. P1-18 TaxID=2024615 RepID=UPI0011F34DBB|nr:HAD family hydrolase [Mycolicibacterium sp. P1-18]KAA0098646.1 haloacid dehalogenase [Mycolicibacterium sp. P1-18]